MSDALSLECADPLDDRVADRVVVLRLGRNNGIFRVSETTNQEIIAAITGATTNAVSARAARKASQEEHA